MVFFPAKLANHFERVQDGLRETHHTVEYAFFGIKILKAGESDNDIVRFQNAVEELRPLVACLSSEGSSCADEQEGAAVEISTAVQSEQELTIGGPENILIGNAWVVFAGSGRTLPEARAELEKLTGFPNRDIILAAGRYRTIVAFSDSEIANSSLPAIRLAINRDDSYVRLLSAWCQNYVRLEDHLSCERPNIN